MGVLVCSEGQKCQEKRTESLSEKCSKTKQTSTMERKPANVISILYMLLSL